MASSIVPLSGYSTYHDDDENVYPRDDTLQYCTISDIHASWVQYFWWRALDWRWIDQL